MLPLGLINDYLSKVNNWALEGNAIVKDFIFEGFEEALKFVNIVGEISIKFEHSPNILINLNKVRLTLTTPSENGLTSMDFDLAEEIDRI